MESKEKNYVSAVVYIHNAEKQVGRFLSVLIDYFEARFEHSEIICVNDASEDHSVEQIKVSAKERMDSTSVSIVNLSYYHGIELAMQAGMDLSIGDFVFEFDRALLDFSVDVIEAIYQRSLQGYDIVSAVPENGTKLSSRLFYWLFEKCSNSSGRMTTESFRVLSRRVINRIKSVNRLVPYRKAVYMNSGLKMDTVSYVPSGGSGRIDPKAKRYKRGLAVDALLLFTEAGYRFAMAMTVIMMVLSVFMLVYSFAVYFTANPVEGWTTTILFLSCTFFALFGILTIIVKYLQLLVSQQFKRKHYTYESVEKLSK